MAQASTESVKKSTETLIKELEHCDTLNIPFLVVHPGGGQINADVCIEQIGDLISQVLEKTHAKAQILLEIMAGQGTQVGRTLEQLALLKKKIAASQKLDFVSIPAIFGRQGMIFQPNRAIEKYGKRLMTFLGLEHIKAIHLNDSKQKCGSHVDRHADIGKGTIGLEAFKLIMHDPRLAHP